MPTIIGSTAATKQPVRYEESPERGRTSVERWIGPESAITALVPTLRGAGYSIEYQLTGKTPYVERRSSGASAPSQGWDDYEAEQTAQWELVPQQLIRDLKLAPYFNTSVTAALSNAYNAVDVDLNVSGVDVASNDYDTEYSTSSTKGNRYRDLRVAGTDSYIEYSYIIRYIRVVGQDTSLAIDATGVNEVTAIPVPNVPAVVTFIQGLGFEWLKKAPSFRYLGTGRFELTLEWWGTSAWAANVYTGGTG